MTPDGRTIEVDIMTLFNQIDHKLDAMVIAMATKAETIIVSHMQEKLAYLEVNGTQHAQTAAIGVKELQKQISTLGWRVALALGSAILAVGSTAFMVFTGLKK